MLAARDPRRPPRVKIDTTSPNEKDYIGVITFISPLYFRDAMAYRHMYTIIQGCYRDLENPRIFFYSLAGHILLDTIQASDCEAILHNMESCPASR